MIHNSSLKHISSTRQHQSQRTYRSVLNSRFVVVGGGTAGISVAAQLKRAGVGKMSLITPGQFHYYQPGWTLVGADLLKLSYTVRPMKNVIPQGTEWIEDEVIEFLPEESKVKLRSGKVVDYDYLIVATGLEIYWKDIKGLEEAMGKNGVCSNYSYDTVPFTREFVKNFKGGKAIFSHPASTVKCAGAPQKIMYLCEDIWTKKGIRDSTDIHFYTSLPVIFGVPYYAKPLAEICKSRNLQIHFRHVLTEVIGDRKQAVFTNLETKEKIIQDFDLLHVTPPMGPVSYLKNSPISDSDGYVAVDKTSLQHLKYPNIYALGDCAGIPTSKTAAAISSQAPVLVKNLLSQSVVAKYDGYTSCPIPTKNGKLLLAEFDYNLTPKETFPYDQRKESRFAFLLKKYMFPWMYWNRTLQGKWKGPSSLNLPFIAKPKDYKS
jgi:sulfide:quinone oxidoreductase